ncbi:sugar phosphate isomerase/epimerase family protein [Rhodococcus sp. NPDC056743]|uniref:sugar phosphate isomerase/epimerase family protein n=1 Tax=Rhodococcus sp. NPDC056743 TaxID=3345934 RepID=UPI00366F7EC6
MHSKISVSGLCFRSLTLPALVEELHRLGVNTTTLLARDLQTFGVDRARDLLASSNITVAALIGNYPKDLTDPQTWDLSCSELTDAVDAAVLVGAPAVYTVTGPLIGDENASFDAFARFIEPVTAHARRAGVEFLVESTLNSYSYVSFAHTLDTTIRLARQCDMGICLDLFHTWNDPDLSRVLRESIDRISLIQIGDSAVDKDGTTQKQIPGEGSVPLNDILTQIVNAGYKGVFDLEIDGPLIDAVGGSAAAERALTFLDRTLAAAHA